MKAALRRMTEGHGAKFQRYPSSWRVSASSTSLRGSAISSLAALIVLIFVCFPPLASAVGPSRVKETRRVLIFNDLGSISSPGFAAIDNAVLTGLEKSKFQIEFYNENLETTLFPDQDSQQSIRNWFARKYHDRKPDVIIAVGRASIQFMLESHQQFFPNTPIVFCGSTEQMADKVKLDPFFTGVWGVPDPEKTLQVALRLQPATKHVVVVGGVAAFDKDIVSNVKTSLRSYETKLDFTYLTDLDMPSLLDRLARLPENTIVFHTSIMQDAAGNRFIDATQSAPMVARAANAPVFVVDDVDLGRGTVGGYLLSWRATGELAAAMAVRVLNGEKPHDIAIEKSRNSYMFDWEALRHWGFDERDLPEGSIVLNRRLSAWEQYQPYIVGGIALILLQGLLISGLLWQRTQRRKTELALANLTGRLITAQEQERSRIAREIHDDYQQRLALVANELDGVSEQFGASVEAKQQVRELWNQVSELAHDMHSLSHRLHSSTLENLGLVAGVRAFCEEFEEQQGLQISFTSDAVPRRVRQDAALCMFRVAQEAIRNVKKHSGSVRANVKLECIGEMLHMHVYDAGKGFDPSSPSADSGIGIRSMEERLRLVGGFLEVSSQPSRGTTIHAWVPVNDSNQTAQ